MNNADVFAARLARIEAGGPNTKGTIFVGQDEQHHLGNKAVGKQGKSSAATSTSLTPLSLIAAFGFGLLAAGIASYARFQLSANLPQLEDPDLEMAFLIGTGFVLSLVMAQLLRLTSIKHKALQLVGVFVMACGFHNLAHWLPGPMSRALSPDWVLQVQTEAPPNSARFRGDYYTLFDQTGGAAGDPAATSAALPDCPPALAAAEVTVLRTDNAKSPAKSAHKTLAAAAPDGSACKAP